MFLVHHRCIDLQIVEVPDDAAGVARRLASSCLARMLAKQGGLGDDGHAIAVQHETLFQRCDGDTQRFLRGHEIIPVSNRHGSNIKGA